MRKVAFARSASRDRRPRGRSAAFDRPRRWVLAFTEKGRGCLFVEAFSRTAHIRVPTVIRLAEVKCDCCNHLCRRSTKGACSPSAGVLLRIFTRRFRQLGPNRRNRCDRILHVVGGRLGSSSLNHNFCGHLRSISPVGLVSCSYPSGGAFRFATRLPYHGNRRRFHPSVALFIGNLPLYFIRIGGPGGCNNVVTRDGEVGNRQFPGGRFHQFVGVARLVVFDGGVRCSAVTNITPMRKTFCYAKTHRTMPFGYFHRSRAGRGGLSPFRDSCPCHSVGPTRRGHVLASCGYRMVRGRPRCGAGLRCGAPAGEVLASVYDPAQLLFLLHCNVTCIARRQRISNGLISVSRGRVVHCRRLFTTVTVREGLTRNVASNIV